MRTLTLTAESAGWTITRTVDVIPNQDIKSIEDGLLNIIGRMTGGTAVKKSVSVTDVLDEDYDDA